MATLAALKNRKPVPLGWSSALTDTSAILIIASATLLFRLATLFPEQIDWDEWSFILMGADVAQGHLPFVHQFDLKPPLIFFLFGGVIAMFGKSLLAIRLLGMLCVIAAASFVYHTAKRLTGPWPALAGALVCALLSSAPFGWSTSSELPAIVFLSAAVWCLARDPLEAGAAGLAGLFMALAVLTRTNLAVVALALGLLLVAAAVVAPRHVSRGGWLAYGVAGLVPPAALVLTYSLAGQLPVLKLAMIDVPLAYSGQLGMAEVSRQHALQLYYTAEAAPLLYGPPVILALFGAAFALLRLLRREQAWTLAVITFAAAATVVSLLIGGAAYPHYWLQLMPFAGLLAALGVAALSQIAAPLRVIAAALVLLPCAFLAHESVQAAHPTERAIAEAARHIYDEAGPHPSVWALHKHLVLWYLDSPELSPAGVHPDNLARRAIIDTLAKHGYVGSDEVGRLMALRPRFVVTDAGGKGLAWVRADGKPIDTWLTANYRRDAHFGDVLIYRRR